MAMAEIDGPVLRPRDAELIAARFEAALSRAVLARFPRHLPALHLLGNALTRLGRHREALGVDRAIVKLAPENDASHYNLACSYSNLGLVDQALRSLKRAVELGYENEEWMAEDPDLENVRRDRRFRRILDFVRARKLRFRAN
jgi:tetratricopeptide (TPR) repeat protein